MTDSLVSPVRCQFPGDFRPLLRTDLRKVRDTTAEERHTSDWLLLQVANVFLKKIRAMTREKAWATYAILAEKLGHTPEEAANLAAGAESPPAVAQLERCYSGQGLTRGTLVAPELVAFEILPHLKLHPLWDVSGSRLHAHQENALTEFNTVAECFLFGAGSMRDLRRAMGGKKCRCGNGTV